MNAAVAALISKAAMVTGRSFSGSVIEVASQFDSGDVLAVVAPPTLSEDALYGPVGEWVRATMPNTESSMAALYFSALTALGTMIGRGPFIRIDGARHGVNLFILLIGPTGAGRKGTAVGNAKALVAEIDPIFVSANVASGLASGQGLINQLRDFIPPFDYDPEEDGVLVVEERDKRLLVVEAEFAGALSQIRSDTNTLSPVMRQAWDGDTLRTLTKGDPMVASDPHIGVIAQITPEELRKRIGEVELYNGFMNRFMPVWTERSKLLPFGNDEQIPGFEELIKRMQRAVAFAQAPRVVGLTPAAKQWWGARYPALSDCSPGRLGALTQRRTAQIRRMAMLLALLDERCDVDACHLAAALRAWEYVELTALYVFGENTLSARAELLRDALLAAGTAGLDRSHIREMFPKLRATEIVALLRELKEAHLASAHKEPGAGRSREVWVHDRFGKRESGDGMKGSEARESVPVAERVGEAVVAASVASISSISSISSLPSLSSHASPVAGLEAVGDGTPSDALWDSSRQAAGMPRSSAVEASPSAGKSSHSPPRMGRMLI